MQIGIQFEGADELYQVHARFEGALHASMKRRLIRLGERLTAQVQLELSKGPADVPPEGVRIERLRYPRNPTSHLRVRTGRLRGSVGYTMTSSARTILLQVGPQKVVYARLHEVGGHWPMLGVRIPGRPYITPAVHALMPDIVSEMAAATREAYGRNL